MFKKKIFATIIFCFMFCIICVFSKGDIRAENVYTMPSDITLDVATEFKQNLKFKQSIVIPLSNSVMNNKQINQSKKLDAYIDAEGNTYYFYSNTNILCGFQKEAYYGFHEEIPISKEEAVEIADAYLSKMLPEFYEYTRVFVSHAECDAVYQIQYSYCLQGILTDDLINIYVQENGTIGAFMAIKRAAFRNVHINDEQIKEILKNIEDKEYRYFTQTENGLALICKDTKINTVINKDDSYEIIFIESSFDTVR